MPGFSIPTSDILISSSFVCHYIAWIGKFVFLCIFFWYFAILCCVHFQKCCIQYSNFILLPFSFASCFNQLSLLRLFLCACDSKQTPSAKSRSSNFLLNIYWVSFWLCFTVSFSIQSITMIQINGDRMQPCLTPVYASKVSDSFPSCIAWQVGFSSSFWYSTRRETKTKQGSLNGLHQHT